MAVWSELVTKLWLGSQYIDSSLAVKIMLFSMAPSFIYGSLRGMIDGESERPVNTINLVVSILLFLIFALIGQFVYKSISSIAFAYLLSKLYLGYGTVSYVLKSFKVRLADVKIFLPAGVSVILGGMLLTIKGLVDARYEEGICISLLVMSCTLYIIILYYCRVEWVCKLRERLGESGRQFT
jgi:hypothetical protein